MNVTQLFSLQGKVAVVTGASGGIGRVLALAFADAGAEVGVHGADAGKVNATCSLIEACGRKAVPLQFELSDVERARGDSHRKQWNC